MAAKPPKIDQNNTKKEKYHENAWLYKSFEGMPQNTYYELNLQLNYSCMCGICLWCGFLYKVFGSSLNYSFSY